MKQSRESGGASTMILLLNGEKAGVLRCERLKFRAWYELDNGFNLHISYPLHFQPYEKERALASVDIQEAPDRRRYDPWAVQVTVRLQNGTILRSLKGTYCPRKSIPSDGTIKVEGEECKVLGKESNRSTEKEFDDKSRKNKDREYYNVRLLLDRGRQLSIWGRLSDFPGPALREQVPESITLATPGEQQILRRMLPAPSRSNTRRVVYRDETGFPHEFFLDVTRERVPESGLRPGRRIPQGQAKAEQDRNREKPKRDAPFSRSSQEAFAALWVAERNSTGRAPYMRDFIPAHEESMKKIGVCTVRDGKRIRDAARKNDLIPKWNRPRKTVRKGNRRKSAGRRCQ
jgi:hypothetical protein